MARLGPSAIDFIGYYSSAVDAAVAFALAHRARNEFASTIAADSSYVRGALAVDHITLATALSADDPLAACAEHGDDMSMAAIAGGRDFDEMFFADSAE
jgi:hypothetical protein